MSGLVHVIALVAAVLSAVATVLIRQGLRGGNPYAGFWINLVVGAIGLWAAVLATGGLGRPSATGIALFAVAGIVGTIGGRLLRFISIEQIGASISSALINLYPMISAMLAIIVLGEEVTMPIVLGTLVIVAGTTLLSVGGRRFGIKPWQLVLPVVSACCFGTVAILRKMGLAHMGAIPGSAINVSAAFVGFTALVLAAGHGRAITARGQSLAYFIAAGVAENTSVFLIVVALGLGTVSVVAPLYGSSPIFVLLLSYFFLKDIEHLSVRVVTGTVLIVLGVYLITALSGR